MNKNNNIIKISGSPEGFDADLIIKEVNADIYWKPILVGGVFNKVNQDVNNIRLNPNPLKFKYSRKTFIPHTQVPSVGWSIPHSLQGWITRSPG